MLKNEEMILTRLEWLVGAGRVGVGVYSLFFSDKKRENNGG
jgi:hypothetical protein